MISSVVVMDGIQETIIALGKGRVLANTCRKTIFVSKFETVLFVLNSSN